MLCCAEGDQGRPSEPPTEPNDQFVANVVLQIGCVSVIKRRLSVLAIVSVSGTVSISFQFLNNVAQIKTVQNGVRERERV